jgi:hypothetical protein
MDASITTQYNTWHDLKLLTDAYIIFQKIQSIEQKQKNNINEIWILKIVSIIFKGSEISSKRKEKQAP